MKQKQNETKKNLIKWNFKELQDYLDDKNVFEIAVNSDGQVWILKSDWENTNKTLEKDTVLNIIRLVADYKKLIVDEENAVLETEFYDGSRFSATIPPISEPSFNLRKHSILNLTLDDYVKQGNITKNQKLILQDFMKKKKNILVVGATGSGKTTFANACIQEIAEIDDRVVIVEDTKEIQCTVKNTLRLASTEKNIVSIIQHCLRRTPERLIIGEVRGVEALHLLTAWNSGHGGGICTTHSDTALKGLDQLEQYVMRGSVSPQKKLIANNINLIVVISKVDGKRKVTEIKKMVGLEKENYILENLM